MSRQPKGTMLSLLALLAALAWSPSPLRAAGAPADTLDLNSTLGGIEKEDPLKSAISEAGAGDKKRFVIKTDDDVSTVKKGDVYTDGLKTFFTVVSVLARGSSGGEFELERTAGSNNPDRRFIRVSSVDEKNPGPGTIIARVTLLDLMQQGGWPVYLIAVLAAIMIMLSLNCIVLYRKSRQCPRQFVRDASEALSKGDLDKFEEISLRERGLLPVICRAMTDRFESSTPEDIERRCEMAAAGQISRLRVPVKLINVISVAAPLLGLFGTIVGMVVVFEAVAQTTGAAKATALAAGIRVKLFSTAAALLVAIPSVFAYFILSAMLGGVISEAEQLSEQLMHQVLVIKRKKQAAARRAARDKSAGASGGDDEPAKSTVAEA